MNVHTMTLGAYQTNTYIVEEGGRCAVIDPGYEPETILAFLERKGLTLDAVLLTHGHFDHVGAVEAIVSATGCKLWISEGDWSQPTDPIHTYFYPIANCDFTEVQFFEDQEHIIAAGLDLLVLATPGHTWGSVCFLCRDVLFSGDTLFAGSCGRTDLPGGDGKCLRKSLKHLAQLEGDYRVYPGHGESTTLAQEKQYNPYMR